MNQQRGPLLLIILAVILVSGGSASSIHSRKQQQLFYPGLYSSSSTDNWLGGTGNWSDPSDWDLGLPSGGSDVVIYSGGSDLVFLDTSPNIASLTLGGDTGTSQLADNGTAQTLTIAGALTVNQTGVLYLAGGNTVTAGADSSNAGLIQLENASALQVNGNLSNSGTIYLGYLGGSTDSLTMMGRLDNTGLLQLGSSDTVSNTFATLGGLINRGLIDLEPGTTLHVNGEVNNSGSIGVGSYDASYGSQAQFGSLVNSGGIGIGQGSTLTIAGDVNNTATGSLYLQARVGSPELSIGGSLTNSGGIQQGGGTRVVVGGNLNNTGTIGLSGGGAYFLVNGAASNSGMISFTGDSLTGGSGATFGSLLNSGTIEMEGQQEGASGFSVSGDANNSGAIRGPLYYGGGFSVDGNLNNSGLITVTGLDAGNNLSNSGSIQLSYAVIDGNFINSGDFSLFGLEDMPGTLGVHGNLNNSGQIVAEAFTNVNIGGRLLNTPTGTVDIKMSGGTYVFNAASVLNQGGFTLEPGNTFNVTGGPRAGASALSGFVNSGIVNIGPYSNLTVVGNYTQIAGQTNIGGTLQVEGRGMAIFAGGSVYGEEGTISGPVFSNADISIGSLLSILGNYTQGPNGSLTFDIAGTEPGEYDQLNISGHAELNGLMTVDLIHGFVPELGDIFDIMHFSSELGTFSLVMGLPINGEEHFVLEYNPTDLTLDVVAGPLFETDSDGTSLIASNVASSIASSVTSRIDLSSSTPEPGSLLLLVSGLLCVAYSIRRRMTK